MSNQPNSEARKTRRAARKAAAEKQAKQRRRFTILGAVGVALVLALALIIVPQFGGGSGFGEIKVADAQAADLPSNGMVLGDPNAPVKVVEWGNYQCPFCGVFAREVEPQLINDYVKTGKASFEFRDFAFGGQESNDAAAAAWCALDQGKFWQMHDTLYLNQHGENQGAFTKSRLKEIAKNVGLDSDTFNQCLDSDAHAKDVQASTDGAKQAGLPGTPTFQVNGQTVSYNGYGSLKAVIDAALAK